MKLKLKFNWKSIQELLLRHVEKFVFGLVVLAILFFVAGAMRRETYDKTPEQLAEEARKADEVIKATVPRSGGDVDLDFAAGVENIRIPIKAEFYRHPNVWTPTLWEQRPKRGEPALYAVQDLRASPGHGAVRMTGVDGQLDLRGRTSQGLRWIVLTGLIQIQKQEQAYLEAFGKARFQNREKDYPEILSCLVQRAEFDSLAQTGQPDWKPLPLGQSLSMQERWTGSGRPVVHSKYINRSRFRDAVPVAFPLPPIEYGGWGPEVTHRPEIPLLSEMKEADIPRYDDYSEGYQEDFEEEEGEEEEGFGGYGGGGRRSDIRLDPKTGLPMIQGISDVPRIEIMKPKEVEVIPYQLFRFFDYAVEPGKHYQYRVKLVLMNPNYGVEPRYLGREELGASWFLETDWSDPTELVSMSRDAEVLAGSVKPTVSVMVEPKATVGIPFFYEKTGIELFEEHEVVRGQLLNFLQRPVPESETRAEPSEEEEEGFGGYVEEEEEEEEEGGYMEEEYEEDVGKRTRRVRKERRRPKVEKIEATEKVDFLTGAVLLDLSGGKRLPGKDRKLTEPGTILLLGPEGTLIVRNELDDLLEYQRYKEGKQEARPGYDYEESYEEGYEEEEEEEEQGYVEY